MISKEETKHIASLARIGMNNKEIEKISEDLSAILDWIKKLEKADITTVEPTAHITGRENITREDKIINFENSKKLIKLFPEEKNGYNKVKSVL